ncbi:UNVERIFIED_CONTAM: hypothetical protein Scaly_3037700 [Sesamum calycinum]|uniref:Reverse transcriptase domain-containing protein n=1 Tax=Sesamum calycinum TaxID=2727403 RepID=A0AAW2K8W2_9LAMI
MDMDDLGCAWGAMLRMMVSVDVNFPLKRALKIRTPSEDDHLVTFTYERLTNFLLSMCPSDATPPRITNSQNDATSSAGGPGVALSLAVLVLHMGFEFQWRVSALGTTRERCSLSLSRRGPYLKTILHYSNITKEQNVTEKHIQPVADAEGISPSSIALCGNRHGASYMRRAEARGDSRWLVVEREALASLNQAWNMQASKRLSRGLTPLFFLQQRLRRIPVGHNENLSLELSGGAEGRGSLGVTVGNFHRQLERLDRACCNDEWFSLFPEADVTHIHEACSYHVVVLLASDGDHSQGAKSKYSCFHLLIAFGRLQSYDRERHGRRIKELNEQLHIVTNKETTSIEGVFAKAIIFPLYLFLFYAKAFSGMLRKAEEEGAMNGVRVCQGGPRVTHLLFAYDKFIFCDTNCEALELITGMLAKFESRSGLQVNYQKCGVCLVGMARYTFWRNWQDYSRWDDRSYNQELVEEEFTGIDVACILQISTSPAPTLDTWKWHFGGKGVFSVRNAYRLALQWVDEASTSNGNGPRATGV